MVQYGMVWYGMVWYGNGMINGGFEGWGTRSNTAGSTMLVFSAAPWVMLSMLLITNLLTIVDSYINEEES